MKVNPFLNTAVSLNSTIKRDSPAQGFSDMLGKLVNNAVTNQVAANDLSRQLALGETDEIHSVMIAAAALIHRAPCPTTLAPRQPPKAC